MELGCFGSVLFRDESASSRCLMCHLSDACRQKIEEARAELLEWHKNSMPKPRSQHAKFTRVVIERGLERTPDSTRAGVVTDKPLLESGDKPQTPEALVPTLNTKPRQVLEAIRKRGIRVEDLRRGVNPFPPESSAFLRASAEWLINAPGLEQLTRQGLAKHLEHELQWAEKTASSYTNIVLEILEHTGCVIMDGARIHPRRDSGQ